MSVTISIIGNSEDKQFQMKMTNNNFVKLWESLGFPIAYQGVMRPHNIIGALCATHPALVATQIAADGAEIRVMADGVEYPERLFKISQEAMRREECVVWG